MMELDVISYLNSDTTLDTLLGTSGSDTKIYPIVSEQDMTIPYIVYNLPSEGTLEENLLESTISFDVIDDDFITAKNIRDRLVTLLDKQHEIQNYITSSSYTIYWSKWTGANSFVEPDLKYYHRVAIFEFKYALTIATRGIDMINKIIPWKLSGVMVDEHVYIPAWYFPRGVTITKAQIFCSDGNEPTGADLTFDILKDDVEQGRIITLSAGSTSETTDITDITFTPTEKFGIKCKSVGSTFEGENITINLIYQ